MSEYTYPAIEVVVAGGRMVVNDCCDCPLKDGEFSTCNAILDGAHGADYVDYMETTIKDEHGVPIGDTLPSNCPLRAGPVTIRAIGEIPPAQKDD